MGDFNMSAVAEGEANRSGAPAERHVGRAQNCQRDGTTKKGSIEELLAILSSNDIGFSSTTNYYTSY